MHLGNKLTERVKKKVIFLNYLLLLLLFRQIFFITKNITINFLLMNILLSILKRQITNHHFLIRNVVKTKQCLWSTEKIILLIYLKWNLCNLFNKNKFNTYFFITFYDFFLFKYLLLLLWSIICCIFTYWKMLGLSYILYRLLTFFWYNITNFIDCWGCFN